MSWFFDHHLNDSLFLGRCPQLPEATVQIHDTHQLATQAIESAGPALAVQAGGPDNTINNLRSGPI
jgi:hypothetical protein